MVTEHAAPNNTRNILDLFSTRTMSIFLKMYMITNLSFNYNIIYLHSVAYLSLDVRVPIKHPVL